MQILQIQRIYMASSGMATQLGNGNSAREWQLSSGMATQLRNGNGNEAQEWELSSGMATKLGNRNDNSAWEWQPSSDMATKLGHSSLPRHLACIRSTFTKSPKVYLDNFGDLDFLVPFSSFLRFRRCRLLNPDKIIYVILYVQEVVTHFIYKVTI